MNKIINTFLSTGDKFMSEMHLRQPGFTYSTYELFCKQRKNKKIKKHGVQDTFIKMN